MRSKQAFRNVLSSISLQIITVLTGIYIPQLMIRTYGSDINGMVSSITQFISYLSLVEAGVSNAAIVALYTPLAINDKSVINKVMSAAKIFYLRSGIAFITLLFVLVVFYPFFVNNKIDPSLIRWMVLVLGCSFIVDYFFLGKYRVILTANQKGYIITVAQSVGTVLNSVLTIILIYAGCDILFVKIAATIVYILRAIYIYWYVKRNYSYLDFNAEPNYGALKQKWDVLVHQITGIVVNSTDVVVLTVALRNLAEVSVYTTYNLIVSNIITLVDSFSNGLCAGFGEAFAKNEKKIVRESYSTYEYIYFIIAFAGCTCLGSLFIPFMKLYTANITDANYIRPLTAILFTLIALCRGIRTPALTMIMAVGHYKETKKAAVFEALINIIVSFILVMPLGINGVLIGTLCSYLYRTTDIIRYTSKNIISDTIKRTIERISRNAALFCIMVYIFSQVTISTWKELILMAIIIGILVVVLFIVINGIFEWSEMKKAWRSSINAIRR